MAGVIWFHITFHGDVKVVFFRLTIEVQLSFHKNAIGRILIQFHSMYIYKYYYILNNYPGHLIAHPKDVVPFSSFRTIDSLCTYM